MQVKYFHDNDDNWTFGMFWNLTEILAEMNHIQKKFNSDLHVFIDFFYVEDIRSSSFSL